MLRTLAFLALTAVLYPQSYTGSISGRVTDATGSVVPGAAVVVTETNTNTVARTLTNDVGDYVVSFLNPGVYKVSVTREGFREQVQTALALQINQASALTHPSRWERSATRSKSRARRTCSTTLRPKSGTWSAKTRC